MGKKFAVVAVVAACLLLVLNFHVVSTPSGIVVAQKDHLALAGTWVDARDWTLADLRAHGDVVRALHRDGKVDAIPQVGQLQTAMRLGMAPSAAGQPDDLSSLRDLATGVAMVGGSGAAGRAGGISAQASAALAETNGLLAAR